MTTDEAAVLAWVLAHPGRTRSEVVRGAGLPRYRVTEQAIPSLRARGYLAPHHVLVPLSGASAEEPRLQRALRAIRAGATTTDHLAAVIRRSITVTRLICADLRRAGLVAPPGRIWPASALPTARRGAA